MSYVRKQRLQRYETFEKRMYTSVMEKASAVDQHAKMIKLAYNKLETPSFWKLFHILSGHIRYD